MAKSKMNLQDSFLNQIRKDNSQVKLVLLDGTILQGCVRGFDNFTVILACKNTQHMIYKHAIAHVVANRAPARRESAKDDAGARGPRRDSQPPKEPKAKEEGFNTLNLSRVTVSE